MKKPVMKHPLPAAIAATAVVGGVLTAAIGGAQADAGTAHHVETYQAPFKNFQHSFVGADEKHPQVGDRTFDRFTLTQGGHTVGTAYNSCTVVSASKPVAAQCVGSFVLPHGQINALVSTRNGHGPTTVLGIAGGTGRYVGATGTVAAVPGKTAITITIRY